MLPKDDLRGAYKQFIESPVGRDFLTRIVAYETQLQTENYAPNTVRGKKLSNIDKMSGLYWVRSQLDDLSKPAPSVARKSTRSGSQ